MGSANCAKTANACGGHAGGYTAAISQNMFGAGPGQGAGDGCGHCWRVETGGKSIVVTVDNLCPIEGNERCNQANKDAKNADGESLRPSVWTSLMRKGDETYFLLAGATVHIDLCKDTGASDALLGGLGFAMGTATNLGRCSGQSTVQTL